MKPHYPEFQSPTLEADKIFYKLHPNEVYIDRRLRNLYTDLTHLIENLLLFEKLSDQKWERKLALLEIYLQQGCDKVFLKEFNQLKKELEQEEFRDEQYFERQYQLTHLHLNYLQSRNLEERYRLLQQSDNALTAYYKLARLKLTVDQSSLQRFFTAKNPDIPFDVTKEKLFQLLEQLQALNNGQGLEAYQKAKSILLEYLIQFRPGTQQDALTILINFAIQQMNVDDKTYNKEVYELYRFGIEEEILINEGRITDKAYLNAAVTAAKDGQLKWAKQFIKDYRSLLAPVTATDTYQLALAYILFEEQDFESSSSLLQQHQFSDPAQQISARVHLLRCYYEIFTQNLNDFDFLKNQVDAFERFIRRKQHLSDIKQKAYLNFASFLKKIIEVKHSGLAVTSFKNKYLDKLFHTPYLLSRNWLKVKIKQL